MFVRHRQVLVLSVFFIAALAPSSAQADLTISPLTWNIIGLDSNDVSTGPNNFPVGARVCSDAATTNVSVDFEWDSANGLIDLRPGSLGTITIPSIAAGTCEDAYFEVSVTRNAAAFDTTRRYHITATDFSGTVSTPTPREVYVEHLISQNRNSISDVTFGTTLFDAVSVPAGGGMNMVVGNTYVIQLAGGTATQGYNQFEEFINFPNTIFQILSVETTYSADNSPFVANPSDMLYADACGWENDPNSPNYRSCVGGDFKAGGNSVVTTYTIRVVSGGGTSQTLGSLLYDFSGSSFHYNSDYETSARIANVIDPTTATISKSFSPNPASLNAVSALTITLSNPNPGTVSGYNFVDNLPANLVVATPPAATTTGCGSPTLTANAGASTISFSNGTLAANSNCVIKVNVTPTATGSLVNTTDNLFIDSFDTGDNATDTLTVNNAPPAGTGLCGTTIALWDFPTGFTPSAPVPSSGSGSAAAGAGLNAIVTSHNSTINPAAGTVSWGSNGSIAGPSTTLDTTQNEYFEFAINTTGLTSISLSFDAEFRAANGPKGLALFYGTTNTRPETGTQVTGGGLGANALSNQNTWVHFGPFNITTGLNPSGTTFFRIYAFNAGNQNSGSDIEIDHVLFTGCAAATAPTIAKSFSPDPIAVNGTSTLTFSLTNTNAAALTGAAFTDSLPAGLQVAATPAAATTCGGTWAPGAGATSLTFSGGTIPANGSCTVSVNVTATTAGPHANVGGFLSTTESGTSTTSLPTDTLTALLPPQIAKQFNPSPIVVGATSMLIFTITNPNQNDALSSVAFTDTLPSSPAQMQVAPAPAASVSGCGSPTFAPSAGGTSITFSGGTIAGGSICVVSVDVTVPAVGTYNNTSGNVSTVINAVTVNGNTASDSLVADPPTPSISLLKQVSLDAGGPWSTFVAVTGNVPVFYRFTVENTGDVPFSPISITDDTLDVSTCNAGFAAWTLPAPVAANESHIVTCIVGPVPTTSGTHTNTAHATGTFSNTPFDSEDSSATYATTGLTLDKTAVQSTFTLVGDTVNYNYLVTNSGFAPLVGPVTVSDDKTTVTCPAVSTVGDLDNFLDPGESITCTATYTIVLADVTNAFVTNTATAAVAGVSSNSDSTTVFLSTSADVSIVKTLTTAGPYTAGQTITYSLVASNAGPATATSVQVTDTPTNLSITSVSGAGCVAFPCVIPSIAAMGSEIITVSATIVAPGAFDNVATVSAAQPDPNTANNTDNTGNNGITGASADVSVVKTLETDPPYFHQDTITYTLLVANAGPSTATNVQITDVPTNLTITGVSGGGCSFPLPCTIPSLAANADVTITVTATIDAPGAFDNSATVDADEPDPNPSNNTDNTENDGTADPSADVSVGKTLDTADPYTAGQTVTYTITVANGGPSTATNIEVDDTPSNLVIQTVSSTNCSAFPCTIPSLASLGSEVITVTATISAAGTFNNSADAFAEEPDPNVSNNTDNTGNSGEAAATADVSITKTLDTAGPYFAGQTVTYTLEIDNAGPSPATDVNVVDTPTNLSIIGVSGDCTSLPCTIPNIASLGSATITVTARIVAAGTFDNSATATGNEDDPDPTDNTDDTENDGTAAPSADVSVVKTLTTAGPFSAGQSISYTIEVTNDGPSPATNIDVVDTPTNLAISSVTGACTSLPCTILTLDPLSTASIAVTATISAAGPFDNEVTANGDEADPDSSNNADDTENGGTAAASADVSVVKTLTTVGPFTVGQSVTYTIEITNDGPSPATNIQVTDTPTNLTVTNVSGACTSLVSCTILSLDPLATTSITVTATIDADGVFDNSVTAIGNEPDPDTSNNTDNTDNSGIAGVSADVSVVKTLETDPPYFHQDTISYTLLVANAGPSTATNVQITDAPTNLTITGVSGGGCSLPLPCTIPSLAANDDVTITLTATIDAPGVFDNSATVGADEPDPDSSNNTDDTENNGTADPSADVSVDKALDTAGPYTAGQTVTYTITVTNGGPSTATNIEVNDTPTNLAIQTVSSTNCSAFPCTIPSLASLGSEVITVTATINAAGAFDNSATVDGDENDPNPSNNTDNTENGGAAGPSADVSVVKTLTTAGPFNVGQSVTYTIEITNGGPSPATNIQVTDTPTNLTVTNVSGACTSLVACTILTLDPLASTSITVTATIDAEGVFDNSVTVSGSEPDPNTENNTDDTENAGTTGASADVSVVKTLTSNGPFFAGQSINYTIVVTNAGTSTATNIDVADTPTNLSITSFTSASCASVPCTIPSLSSGSSESIAVTATIVAAGAFDNSVTVSAEEFDPIPSNNTDDEENGGNASPSADMSIVKTLDTTGPFAVGDSISYTLEVLNSGPSTATNIQVTDTPTNLTITNVSSTNCSGLPCTISSLASGASEEIIVTATIDAAGAFDNTATVDADENDPIPSNNTDSTENGGTAAAAPSADLSVEKTLTTSAPFVAGQSVTYTVEVTNGGPSTATSVEVTDTSSNLTITSVSGAGCAQLPCAIASIPSGESVTITVTATINAIGAFDNVATALAAETDPNPNNNTDDSGNGGVAASIQAIPTASEYGLILFALLLAIAAVTILRS